MYLSQVFNFLHEWWRYTLGLILIIIGTIIGQIPFTIAVFYKAFKNGTSMDAIDQSKLLGFLEPNLSLFLMLLSFAIGLLALFLVVKYFHKESITQLTTSRKKIDWNRFLFIFLLWGIASIAFILIDYIVSPNDYVLNFNLLPFLILCFIAVIFIPLQTSFEEYLFRGYLMQGLGAITKNKWLPLLITSVSFGLMHITNPEVEKLGHIILIYYIGTGLFLGILTLMDEGLELALGFHAANNLFTALLVSADWTVFQTHSILKDISDPKQSLVTDIIVPVFVVFPIIIYILSKKYNWHNWQEKLLGKVSKEKAISE